MIVPKYRQNEAETSLEPLEMNIGKLPIPFTSYLLN